MHLSHCRRPREVLFYDSRFFFVAHPKIVILDGKIIPENLKLIERDPVSHFNFGVLVILRQFFK